MGRRPSRPEEARALGLSDAIWEVVEKCWQKEREERPTISHVLQRLQDAGHIVNISHFG